MNERLTRQLTERMTSDLIRKRSLRESPQQSTVVYNHKSYIAFNSNDYLGLANHPKAIQALQQAASDYGVGSGASTLLGGYHRQHAQLEEALADFLGEERVLLFSTGYMANLAVQTVMLGRHAIVIHDRLNHASLLDGAKMSGAQLYRYRHNDCEHLHQILTKTHQKSQSLVVTEGVFSMDGDIAPLPEIVQLCHLYQYPLLLDDAHGFGVLGSQGRGTVEHFNLAKQQIPLRMISFGKALGTFGACIAGSHSLIEALIQFGRTYIYTTAMPVPLTAASYCNLQLMQQEKWRIQRLQSLIAYFRQETTRLNLPFEYSITAIQPLILGSPERAIAVHDHLLKAGYLVALLRPPTVPTSRLRFSLSAEHTEEQIKAMLTELAQALSEYP